MGRGVRAGSLAALCVSLLSCSDADVAPPDPTTTGMGVMTTPDAGTAPTPDTGAGTPPTTTGRGAGATTGDVTAPLAGPVECATGTLDSDADGVADCEDACPADPMKQLAGECGCGTPEPADRGACEGACEAGEAGCEGAPDPGQPDAGLPAEPDEEELCAVEPLPDELRSAHRLDPVYTRWASARGVPILASDSPSDESLRRACMMVRDLSAEPMVLATMLEEQIGLVVMGLDETSADFPEFAAWGVPDWRARGLGGVPRGLCAEENIMCDTASDRWRGESICLHEFIHTMHLGVYNKMDPTFDDRVEAAYRAAVSAGKYARTYAESNAVEYFAEAGQDWYNTNLESIPADGVHNEINTRAELEAYDPEVYAILAEVLPDEPQYVDCYNHE